MGKIYSVEIKKRFEVMNLLISGVITEIQAAEQLSLRHRNLENSDDARGLLKTNYEVFEHPVCLAQTPL